MRWYSDLTIKTKLFVSFGAVVALAAILGIVGLTAIATLKAEAISVGEVQLPGAVIATNFKADMRTAARDVRTGMMTAGDNSKWYASFQDVMKSCAETLVELQKYAIREEERRALSETVTAFEAWRKNVEKIAELARTDKNEDARKLLFDETVVAETDRANAAVEALVAEMKKSADAVVAEGAVVAERTRAATLGLLAAVLVVSMAIAWANARQLSSQIAAIADRAEALRSNCITNLGKGMEAMSRGDVSFHIVPTTPPIELDSKDELGQLADTINGAISQTQRTIEAYDACKGSLSSLVDEAARLTRAGRDGRLSERGDVSKFEGRYRDLVQGVNDTLQAVIAPVDEAARVLDRVAARDFTAEVQGAYRGDHARIKEALNTAVREVRSALGTIGQSAQALAASSEELSAVATQIGGSSEETSTQSAVVSAAAEQVSKNVQTVATGTEEMTASIKEIAKSAAEAARVAGQAVKVAESTNATVAKLGTSSAEISEVIKVITSIAQQTNLLALNATIEAARAGEAGKGFAVVANEVKELAKETAKATEDIGRKIEAIQSDSQDAVTAIAQISEIIAQIDDIQGTIASAVEEQTATTNEIGRNVAQAAAGSEEIARNITGVAQAAGQTAGGAQQGLAAAQDLAKMSAELQALVAQFRIEGSSAPMLSGATPSASRSPARRPSPRADARA